MYKDFEVGFIEYDITNRPRHFGSKGTECHELFVKCIKV